MRIRTMSDIHRDHYKGSAAFWVPPMDIGEYDVFVILGDVSNAMMDGLPYVADNCVRPGIHTLYVPGNHCLYRGQGWENTFAEEQLGLGREFCAQNGIRFMNNDAPSRSTACASSARRDGRSSRPNWCRSA